MTFQDFWRIGVFVCVVTIAGAAHAETAAVPSSSAAMQLSFAPIVKQAAPAVVNIYTRTVIQQRVLTPFDDPFFRDFFGDALPPGMTRQRVENSLGSGVIVSPDGLIVTNNHVIRGADDVQVVLADKREYGATVVAVDEKTDLAVLRMRLPASEKNASFPWIPLRDSDTAEVGDLVLAIGNPFGIGQTVTSGILSSVARTGVSINSVDYYLQTDAAINPGNSGGALVTTDGKLVGVNAAIYSKTGGSIGIGFAIPSNLVQSMVTAVRAGQTHVVRPWLGLDLQPMTADLARMFKRDHPEGVVITALHEASPAKSAGLEVGEAILSLNDHVLNDVDSVRFRLATLGIGSTARLVVLNHDGVPRTLDVALIAPPRVPAPDTTTLTGQHPLTGVTVENISPATIEAMNLPDSARGVVVTKTDARGASAYLGLAAGDIVMAINNKRIESVDDLRAALADSADGWRIQIGRGGQTLNLLVR